MGHADLRDTMAKQVAGAHRDAYEALQAVALLDAYIEIRDGKDGLSAWIGLDEENIENNEARPDTYQVTVQRGNATVYHEGMLSLAGAIEKAREKLS